MWFKYLKRFFWACGAMTNFTEWPPRSWRSRLWRTVLLLLLLLLVVNQKMTHLFISPKVAHSRGTFVVFANSFIHVSYHLHQAPQLLSSEVPGGLLTKCTCLCFTTRHLQNIIVLEVRSWFMAAGLARWLRRCLDSFGSRRRESRGLVSYWQRWRWRAANVRLGESWWAYYEFPASHASGNVRCKT